MIALLWLGIGSFYFLRTLLAENNKLGCCQALQQMHGLVKLMLRGNVIEKLKFDNASLYQLQVLDVSSNRIQAIGILNGIPKLQELNLDNNNIEIIQIEQPITTLRILKLNYNRLHGFNGLLFPNLKILYLDKNRLVRISALSSMRHLDALSLRDQGGQQLQANMKYLKDTRKLYLSGMPIKQLNNVIHFNNLEYLELCSGQLEELPHDFALQVPQLRILYLSHNYLKHIGPLQHHRRLQKLILIDNRFEKLGGLLETLRTLPRLHVLDIRRNPINWKMYDEILYTGIVKSKKGRMHPLCHYLGPEYDTTWISRDASYFQALPKHWQRRRNMYRALCITETSQKLEIFDNIPITTEELALATTIVNEYVVNQPQL
ncbi:hypothetical protein BCR42DRAFT_70481 [Absidia repens]|uniref:Uncharacterized protein n=1 Tax=Absidia repens TaxID=90262 RepID=A0A1X2IB38_9FUNG|nr:hypothetical protein BCR42DRAFT_70481 [Absidia repens]